MVEIHVQHTFSAPVSEVFDWLTDPVNLATAPMVLRAGFARGSTETAVGAVRQVLGTGVWFREAITAYDRPRSYSYLIVRSMPAFRHEGGTVTCSPTPNGGTHVDWVSRYTHPRYAGGKAMEQLTVRLLPVNFRAILRACARALDNGDGATSGA